jgi:DNA-directed RNA polymerase specialized sigma24 family protein
VALSSFGEHGGVEEWVVLDAARGGDERAFGILLDRHRPGLETVCRLMLGDPRHAERAMQEAVLNAWRERGLVPASSSARVWLYGIAVRVCLEALEVSCDEFRRRRTFDGVNGDEEPDGL